MARKRRSSSRRAPAGRAHKGSSAPAIPVPGPGERLWVLQDVPFGAPVAPAVWVPQLKAHLLAARELPGHLSGFQSQPYTYARLVEDTLNGTPGPVVVAAPMTPRPVQVDGAKAIVTAARQGWPQFLLGDEPGVGKTLSAILAVKLRARLTPGTRRVLVIADRPASITIGHWCRSIGAVGDGGLTWCVVTWDQLAKVAGMDWDVVVADEAHMVRHRTTKRWGYYQRITGWSRKTRQPWQLSMTATPMHEPQETGYLSGIYAHHHGEPVKQWATDFEERLVAHGIHLVKGRYGWKWSDDPGERARDMRRLQEWTAGALLAREAPWGPPPVSGMAVQLTAEQWAAYEEDWGEFCAERDLARRGRNAAKGRAALLRFRQKAGMLRVDATCEWIASRVEADRQVAVSCEFVDTAAVPIRERLSGMGYAVAGIYGAGQRDSEEERVRFQRGQARVIVFTPTASLSLHSGEMLADGSRGSSAPRMGIFHQARYSGIAGRQVTGRTHRDYQVSPWTVAYARGTVEEQVASVMVQRYAATSGLSGGDVSALGQVMKLLGVEWLPAGVLLGD